jgi:hypothetical protein
MERACSRQGGLLKTLWQWSLRLGAAAIGTTALVGLLHLPAARPLLSRLGALCPVRATPAEIENARRVALRKLRGTDPAPGRPALGFTLESTTLAAVQAWAKRAGVRCELSMQDTLLKCDAVPASAVAAGGSGTFDEVAFGFRIADHALVNLTTLSTGLDVPAASSRFNEIAGALGELLGPPTRNRLPTASWDAKGPVFVEYRYADYVARVSAMDLPGRGVVLRGHYLSARDDGRAPVEPAGRHTS